MGGDPTLPGPERLKRKWVGSSYYDSLFMATGPQLPVLRIRHLNLIDHVLHRSAESEFWLIHPTLFLLISVQVICSCDGGLWPRVRSWREEAETEVSLFHSPRIPCLPSCSASTQDSSSVPGLEYLTSTPGLFIDSPFSWRCARCTGSFPKKDAVMHRRICTNMIVSLSHPPGQVRRDGTTNLFTCPKCAKTNKNSCKIRVSQPLLFSWHLSTWRFFVGSHQQMLGCNVKLSPHLVLYSHHELFSVRLTFCGYYTLGFHM